MENAINVTITPLQALLSLAFQVWIVVFPIIIIKKLNYLTSIIEPKNDDENAAGNDSFDNQ